MNLLLRRTSGLQQKLINPASPLRSLYWEKCMLCSHPSLEALSSVSHVISQVEAWPLHRHLRTTLFPGALGASASASASLRHVLITLSPNDRVCVRHVHTTTPRKVAVSKLKEASADSSDEKDSQKPAEHDSMNNALEGSPSAKIVQLVKEIANLTLLEASDLSHLLKKRLGLSESGMPYYGGGMGGVLTGGAAAPAAEEEKKPEKTNFDVKLEKFDAAAKIKIIKEVRTFTSLGLKEAKELVEKLPAILKKGVAKEEAEQIIEKLKAVSATVVLE